MPGCSIPRTAPPRARRGFPQLSNRLYFEAVEPFLAARTKDALESRELAAGVEYVSAVVAGVQL